MTTPTAPAPSRPWLPTRRRPSAAMAQRRLGPENRFQAGSPRMPCHRECQSAIGPCLGPRFRLGQFFLPLAERLFAASAPPVTGDRRRPGRVDTTLFADVGPQLVHDGLRLTVDEDVHLTGKPFRGGD